jgi:hypothetical protein
VKVHNGNLREIVRGLPLDPALRALVEGGVDKTAEEEAARFVEVFRSVAKDLREALDALDDAAVP